MGGPLMKTTGFVVVSAKEATLARMHKHTPSPLGRNQERIADEASAPCKTVPGVL